MPLPSIEFRYLGTVHSPFSGLPSQSDDGPNTADPTLLFIYYGSILDYDYISPRVEHETEQAEDLEPEDLAAALGIDGGIVMVVDTDWNGVDHYGFAPSEDGSLSAPDLIQEGEPHAPDV